MVIFATGITYIQRYCTTTYEHLPTHNDFVRARKQAVIEVFNNKTKELANDFAVRIVENAFCDRQESDMDIDEQCIQAREKVQAICCDKPISGYMIDAAFSPMEVTSSSTM